MSESIGKISSGRFYSDRFQQRALRSVCKVPRGLCCPECHHRFDIVVSRKQMEGGILSRRFIRHFRCRVCEHRFARWNPKLTRQVTRLALVVLAFVALVFGPLWIQG